jgi:predicted dehydrogenase
VTSFAPVRWGFVGAGFVASRALAPAVHASPEAELAVAAARDPQRAAALMPRRTPLPSYESVLDDPDVDVVYISLPNDQHHRWITAALRAGKHVVCEKPLTVSAAECRDVQAVADAESRLLVEATWTRWHPRHRRAAALIADGSLGELRAIRAAFTFTGVPEDNYRLDPAQGGGALLDLGPYVLAAVTDWHGDTWQVDRVDRQLHDSGVDLSTRVSLVAPDGATASVNASFVEPEQQLLEVTGSELTLRWGPPAFTSWRAASTLVAQSATERWTEEFPTCDAYQLMVSAVSRRIRGDDTAYLPQAALSQAVADLLDSVAGTPDAR